MSPFSGYGLLLKQSGLNLTENILRRYTEKQSASCTRTHGSFQRWSMELITSADAFDLPLSFWFFHTWLCWYACTIDIAHHAPSISAILWSHQTALWELPWNKSNSKQAPQWLEVQVSSGLLVISNTSGALYRISNGCHFNLQQILRCSQIYYAYQARLAISPTFLSVYVVNTIGWYHQLILHAVRLMIR